MTAPIRCLANLRVAMRDGVTLSADVFLPAGDGPHPALVARTPYNKNTAEASARARRHAEHGYAFAWMDVRGRGDSDGEFVPYRHEGPDGHDAIEWVAAQPWCDTRERIVLRGEVPDLTEPVTGCPFRARCPVGRDRSVCATDPPPLGRTGAGHWTACHFPGELP